MSERKCRPVLITKRGDKPRLLVHRFGVAAGFNWNVKSIQRLALPSQSAFVEVVFLEFPVFKVFLESPVTSISQRCLSFAFRFGDWPLPVSPPNPSTVLESSFPLQSIDYYKAVLAAAGSPSCYSSTRRNVVLPPITRFTPLVRDLVEQTEQSCCWLLDDITHSLVCR